MRSSSAVWLAARSAAFWGLSESALVRRGLEWILAALLRLRDPLHLCYTAADLRAAVGIGVAADDTAAMLAAPSMALYLFHLYAAGAFGFRTRAFVCLFACLRFFSLSLSYARHPLPFPLLFAHLSRHCPPSLRPPRRPVSTVDGLFHAMMFSYATYVTLSCWLMGFSAIEYFKIRSASRGLRRIAERTRLGAARTRARGAGVARKLTRAIGRACLCGVRAQPLFFCLLHSFCLLILFFCLLILEARARRYGHCSGARRVRGALGRRR